MLSITALATVANAEVWEGTAGTPFEAEGMGVGGSFFASDNELGTTGNGIYFWYAATNEAFYAGPFGVYTNSEHLGVYSGSRPAIAGNASTTNKCLAIDTEGERLYRRFGGTKLNENAYIGGDSDFSVGTFTQYDVTSSIYFDSLVQFTVNEDEAPTIQAGDKLAVWLQGGETTNLVVTAGYVSDSGTITPTNYVIDAVTVEPATWYRLTIEAFPLTAEGTEASNRYLGFRVRIDGNYLSTDQAKMGGTVGQCVGEMGGANVVEVSADEMLKLFPSLVVASSDDGNCGNLSCVAFEGTGAVDDLTFTDTDPFGGVEPPPTEPGYVEGGVTNTYSDAAAFVAAFKAGKVLALPDGWEFNAQTGEIGPENGTAFATVPAYYNVAADGTISLNETIVRPVLGTTEGTGDDPDTEPITIDETNGIIKLNVTNGKAGLYYGVRKYTALGGASSDTWNQTAQTADGNVTLEVPKDATEPAAFYQVIVNDALPAQSGN